MGTCPFSSLGFLQQSPKLMIKKNYWTNTCFSKLASDLHLHDYLIFRWLYNQAYYKQGLMTEFID